MMSNTVSLFFPVRDDCPGRSHAMGFSAFSDDAWLDYVPVRVPDTLCVQERLPPGAAAGPDLTGPNTHTDIYLPIDALG